MARPFTGELVHGTVRGYNYYQCRCMLCLQAWAEHARRTALRRSKLGKCKRCREKSVPGRMHCAEHLKQQREYMARRRGSD